MARVALASAVRPLSTPITTPALLVGARQASAALSTSARRLADAPTAGGEAGGKKTGFLSGLLHGSAAAKDLGDHTESHSTSVARGKYGACAATSHASSGRSRAAASRSARIGAPAYAPVSPRDRRPSCPPWQAARISRSCVRAQFAQPRLIAAAPSSAPGRTRDRSTADSLAAGSALSASSTPSVRRRSRSTT